MKRAILGSQRVRHAHTRSQTSRVDTRGGSGMVVVVFEMEVEEKRVKEVFKHRRHEQMKDTTTRPFVRFVKIKIRDQEKCLLLGNQQKRNLPSACVCVCWFVSFSGRLASASGKRLRQQEDAHMCCTVGEMLSFPRNCPSPFAFDPLFIFFSASFRLHSACPKSIVCQESFHTFSFHFGPPWQHTHTGPSFSMER